jgi:citrate lyase beta subunit
VFSPDPSELVWAEQVSAAMAKAEADGAGAVLVDGKLADLAHLKMVRTIMDRQALIDAPRRVKR